jgi:tRNA(Ile)-lysidine synthase
MPCPTSNVDLVASLLAAWPAELWRDLHVLVSVSGGADSMALMRALLAAKQRIGGSGTLFAGHVDHGLRGDESTADAAWLADQCRSIGVTLFIERANVGEVALVRGDGVEEAARAARYEILTRMAERLGARFVALGHHRDDQIETILFRLFRGSGLRGLSGMRSIRPLSPAVVAVRPLLDVSRDEIELYLAEIGQPWRTDRSNLDPDAAARNAIRRELLPLILQRLGGGANAALLRAGAQAAEAQELIDSLAAQLLSDCRCHFERRASNETIAISMRVEPLESAPPLLASEALRQAWRAAGWPEQAMTHSWWRRLAELAQTPSPLQLAPPLNLPGAVRAGRFEAGVLSLRRVTIP